MTYIWHISDSFPTVFCNWQFSDRFQTDFWYIYEIGGTYILTEYPFFGWAGRPLTRAYSSLVSPAGWEKMRRYTRILQEYRNFMWCLSLDPHFSPEPKQNPFWFSSNDLIDFSSQNYPIELPPRSSSSRWTRRMRATWATCSSQWTTRSSTARTSRCGRRARRTSRRSERTRTNDFVWCWRERGVPGSSSWIRGWSLGWNLVMCLHLSRRNLLRQPFGHDCLFNTRFHPLFMRSHLAYNTVLKKMWFGIVRE